MSTTSAVAAGVSCSVVSVAGTAPCTRRTRCSAGTCARCTCPTSTAASSRSTSRRSDAARASGPQPRRTPGGAPAARHARDQGRPCGHSLLDTPGVEQQAPTSVRRPAQLTRSRRRTSCTRRDGHGRNRTQRPAGQPLEGAPPAPHARDLLLEQLAVLRGVVPLPRLPDHPLPLRAAGEGQRHPQQTGPTTSTHERSSSRLVPDLPGTRRRNRPARCRDRGRPSGPNRIRYSGSVHSCCRRVTETGAGAPAAAAPSPRAGRAGWAVR